MKKLTTSAGVFGPYANIEILEDRYRCDGADLPFEVVGVGVISDAEPCDFPPPPPVMPTLEEYDAALTSHLDSVAQQRRYADRISCAVRAGYPGPFQGEGVAFATWMDNCNAIGYQMLADFQNGLIPQPTVGEVIAALPPMVWPS